MPEVLEFHRMSGVSSAFSMEQIKYSTALPLALVALVARRHDHGMITA